MDLLPYVAAGWSVAGLFLVYQLAERCWRRRVLYRAARRLLVGVPGSVSPPTATCSVYAAGLDGLEEGLGGGPGGDGVVLVSSPRPAAQGLGGAE